MVSKTVRFAVIGCGDIANNAYLPAITSQAELTGVCDTLEERALRTRETWRARVGTTDADELLDRDDVDAVGICSAHASHAGYAIAAAQAGKHFIVQKPMSTTLEDAARVVEAVRSTGVKAVAEPAPHLRPTYRKAREVIESGAIGRPLYFIANHAMGSPVYGSFYLEKEGGGPLYGIAVYSISVLTYLFGPARHVTGSGIHAFESQDLFHPDLMTHSITEDGYDQPWGSGAERSLQVEQAACDNTTTILQFDPRFHGVVNANYTTFAGPPQRNFDIYGTGGAISFGPEAPLTVVSNSGKGASYNFDEAGESEGSIQARSRRAVAHLISCIRNDTEPGPSVEWGRHVSEILIGSEVSAETGQAIKLHSRF